MKQEGKLNRSATVARREFDAGAWLDLDGDLLAETAPDVRELARLAGMHHLEGERQP